MAQPIRFSVPAPDPRAVLRDRVDRAPEEHAQAILAAYELLQALHDRGILDVTTSALRASDELLEKVVDSANTPDAIRAIRNLMFWARFSAGSNRRGFKASSRRFMTAWRRPQHKGTNR